MMILVSFSRGCIPYHGEVSVYIYILYIPSVISSTVKDSPQWMNKFCKKHRNGLDQDQVVFYHSLGNYICCVSEDRTLNGGVWELLTVHLYRWFLIDI